MSFQPVCALLYASGLFGSILLFLELMYYLLSTLLLVSHESQFGLICMLQVSLHRVLVGAGVENRVRYGVFASAWSKLIIIAVVWGCNQRDEMLT